MWEFTPAAKARLETCHPSIKAVVYRAKELSPIPFTVLEGHRDRAAQEKAFAAGTSKLHWPDGKHNADPSDAVDLGPQIEQDGKLVIPWEQPLYFAILCGVMMASAKLLGVRLRWGYDWDSDWDFKDEKGLRDAPHYERIKENH